MAKPRLVKVRALFYVLQQVMKRGCIGILIHPLTAKSASLPDARAAGLAHHPAHGMRTECEAGKAQD